MAVHRSSPSHRLLLGVLAGIAAVFGLGRWWMQRPAPAEREYIAVDLVVIPAEVPSVPVVNELPRPSTWDLGGRLAAPEGRPADASLRVVARPTRERPLQALEGSEVRATVAKDGTFRLVLPTAWERAWIDLSGTHLFLDEPLEIRRGAIRMDLVLRARLGGLVRGTIRLEEGGAPVLTGRSLVRVQPDRGATDLAGRRFDVRPDAQGRFELRGLPPDTSFHVAPLFEGRAPAAPRTVRLAGGESQELAFALPRGHRVAGQVVDEAGAPLPGARVVYEGNLAQDGGGALTGTWRLEDLTDPEGRFELTGFPGGTRPLKVELAGHVLPEPLRLDAAAGAEDLRIVLAPGRVVAGHVRWPNGDPAAELGIELRKAGREPRRLTSDERGRFEARDLESGKFTLFVAGWRRRPDGADQWGYQRVGDLEPGHGELAITLEGGLRLAGEVRDGSDRPLRTFRIEATPLRVEGEPPVVTRQVSSPRGTFQLAGLPPGTWEVFVSADGYASPAPVEVALPRASEDPPLRFGLQALGRITGRVLAPDGAPLAGAEVRPRALEGGVGDVVEPVRTDAFGRFVLEEVPPGTWDLYADAGDLAESAHLPVELPRGGDLGDVLLVLREGATLEGQVLTPEGTPAVGWLVSVAQEDLVHHRTGRSDETGRFRFRDLVPGTWRVIALGPGAAGSDTAFREEELVTLDEGGRAEVRLGRAAAPTAALETVSVPLQTTPDE